VCRAGVRHPVLDQGRRRVEHSGAERVGQRLLVPAGTESGVPSWAQGDLLIQRLLLLLMQPGQGGMRRVEDRCDHEGLRTLLSSGHGAGVHSHVSLPRVAVGQPWCVGSTVGTSGGGGLARRATTASTAGAVLVVVATAITAITVFVVILGPVATGTAVCRHGAGETAWKTVAWPSGTQCWCRVPSGQLEVWYCPCEAPPGAYHPEL
jgi:hypothetical protein